MHLRGSARRRHPNLTRNSAVAHLKADAAMSAPSLSEIGASLTLPLQTDPILPKTVWATLWFSFPTPGHDNQSQQVSRRHHPFESSFEGCSNFEGPDKCGASAVFSHNSFPPHSSFTISYSKSPICSVCSFDAQQTSMTVYLLLPLILLVRRVPTFRHGAWALQITSLSP